MLIACLGWGAPVWDPGDLPRRGPWFTDGPFVPLEFARQAKDGPLTLALVPERPQVRSLWTILATAGLDAACQALAEREQIPARNLREHIGVWTRDSFHPSDALFQRIEAWAQPLGLDAVIWTSLPPCFAGEEGRVPSPWEAVAYLDQLAGEGRRRAEEYVRRTPRQIDTDIRRYIELKLGWTPLL